MNWVPKKREEAVDSISMVLLVLWRRASDLAIWEDGGCVAGFSKDESWYPAGRVPVTVECSKRSCVATMMKSIVSRKMLVVEKGRDDGRCREDLGKGSLSEQGRHHHQQAELTGWGQK